MTALALKDAQPAWLTVARSPTRQALADHLQAITAAEQEAESLKPPVNRAQAAVAEAEAAVREADAAVATINERELAELVETANSGKPVHPRTRRDRTAAEAKADECRRRAELARRALAQIIGPLQDAQLPIAALQAQFAPLIVAVLVELHAEAMRKRAAAMQELAGSELMARAICSALSEEGRRLRDLGFDGMPCFRAAGPMAQAFADSQRYEPPSEAAVYNAAPHWTHFMVRLARDPDAQP
jgi:hypothetical protein